MDSFQCIRACTSAVYLFVDWFDLVSDDYGGICRFCKCEACNSHFVTIHKSCSNSKMKFICRKKYNNIIKDMKE